MKNATVTNSVVTMGNNNTIEVNFTRKQEIDWDLLQKDLSKVLESLPDESNELISCGRAYSYAVREDKNRLFKFIEQNSATFTSNLFSTTASAFLVDFIKNIIK